MFSCIFQFPLSALARMGLCQLCPGLFALRGCAQAVQSSWEPEQALEHSPDDWGDSALLTNLSPLHFIAVDRIFPGDSWLLCWTQPPAVNPAFPASCSHGRKCSGTDSKPHKLLLPKHCQGHCHVPDGNTNFPRNLPGKLMAAVPFVPTSACLSSSTLGDSRVAPNSFRPEQREREPD